MKHHTSLRTPSGSASPGRPLRTISTALLATTLLATGLTLPTVPAQAAPAAAGTAAVAAPATTAAAAPAAATDPSFDQPGARFTLGVLPDTQFYSRYATEETGNQFMDMYGSEPFSTQTGWLAENDEDYETVMTMHLGDVVDQYRRPEQWDVADRALGILEAAEHPYSILAGNHDVGAGASDENPVSYDTFVSEFSPERAAGNSTFGGRDATGAHEYHLFEVDGQQFLVLNLSWRASEASLDWAVQILAEHPGVPTIVNSHQLINVDTDGATGVPTTFGERVWDRVIAPHDQVFLTFNGHHHGATQWTRTNDHGNPVHQVLMDYQMAYMGGNGYMGLVEFDLTNGKISQTSFSPWVMEKPQDTLVADDQALLAGSGQSFTLDFDFAARFPGLAVGEPTDPSYTQELRDWISANYQPPSPRETVAPTGEDDYPQVADTRAHWRMPAEGSDAVAPVGATIEDVAAGNTFTRAPLNEGAVRGAQESDVTWSPDHHPLSANGGSVCFDNAGRTQNTASYFTTADGAPVNTETFEEGFTFETFLRIDPEFTPAENEWMQWLVRDGKRGNVEGYTNSEGDEPPFAWAFSNLKEVQFSFVDGQEPPGETSAWSGEIVNLGEWLHLAAVNDPATQMTTLYVEGVPVLRNSPGTVGMGHDGGLSWILGAGAYAGERQSGFLGCIGETRLVEGPLDQDEWLTARAVEPVDFADNTPGSRYYEPVRWMQTEGLTTGYTDQTYRKDRQVSRGESLAFIHRYLDPETPAGAEPFTDVPATHPFHGPISWGHTAGIAQGYADGEFKPTRPVTRGEFASFLYRAVQPTHLGPEDAEFSDLETSSAHYQAITWMASEGISIGYGDGTWRPGRAISRGEVAVLLYRYETMVADRD